MPDAIPDAIKEMDVFRKLRAEIIRLLGHPKRPLAESEAFFKRVVKALSLPTDPKA